MSSPPCLWTNPKALWMEQCFLSVYCIDWRIFLSHSDFFPFLPFPKNLFFLRFFFFNLFISENMASFTYAFFSNNFEFYDSTTKFPKERFLACALIQLLFRTHIFPSPEAGEVQEHGWASHRNTRGSIPHHSDCLFLPPAPTSLLKPSTTLTTILRMTQ